MVSVRSLVGSSMRQAKHLAKRRIGPWVAGRQPTRVDLAHSRWGLAIGPNRRLWRSGLDLEDLARREGTPLHLVDEQRLLANAEAALRPLREGAGADVFYSYKTNPVPGVLRRLHSVGVGAEVISAYELWLAFELGVPPERIVYNGPAKSIDSIRDAVGAGVHLINANSASEVRTIAQVAAAEERPVRMGVRASLPETWRGQFGIAADSAEIDDAVRFAMQAPLVELCGLHVHRGIVIRTEVELTAYVGAVLRFCDELRRRTGFHPSLLDIGGSIACPTVAPIPYRQFRLHRALHTDLLPPEPADAIVLGEASRLAAELVERHFGAAGLAVPRLIMEPGRALTADTQLLLTSVLDVKRDTELHHAILDAGINVAEPLHGEYHQLFSVSAPESPHLRPYRLVGPICTPADVLYQSWRLPDLEPGHVLAVMDTGAYFVPFSTEFSFPRPPILAQHGDRATTLRRRQVFDDLVHLDGDDPEGPPE